MCGGGGGGGGHLGVAGVWRVGKSLAAGVDDIHVIQAAGNWADHLSCGLELVLELAHAPSVRSERGVNDVHKAEKEEGLEESADGGRRVSDGYKYCNGPRGMLLDSLPRTRLCQPLQLTGSRTTGNASNFTVLPEQRMCLGNEASRPGRHGHPSGSGRAALCIRRQQTAGVL